MTTSICYTYTIMQTLPEPPDGWTIHWNNKAYVYATSGDTQGIHKSYLIDYDPNDVFWIRHSESFHQMIARWKSTGATILTREEYNGLRN